jgi:MoxR-like ATPase
MEAIQQEVQGFSSPWEKASFALSNNLGRVLLYGKPGTGKTYFAMNYHTNPENAYRLVCTEEMTDADLIGMYKPTVVNGSKELMFHEGVAIKAWRTGGRLVVDEIN